MERIWLLGSDRRHLYRCLPVSDVWLLSDLHSWLFGGGHCRTLCQLSINNEWSDTDKRTLRPPDSDWNPWPPPPQSVCMSLNYLSSIIYLSIIIYLFSIYPSITYCSSIIYLSAHISIIHLSIYNLRISWIQRDPCGNCQEYTLSEGSVLIHVKDKLWNEFWHC